MRKTERTPPRLDAAASSLAATTAQPTSTAYTEPFMSNVETTTAISLVPNPSKHIKRHRKRRQIKNETISDVVPPVVVHHRPPFAPDCEIVDSILVAGDGREEQEQQGSILERGPLDQGEEWLAIKQVGVYNDSSGRLASDRTGLLHLEGGTEQNRLRHLGGATSPNKEEKRRRKKLKQESLASPISHHKREKNSIVAGEGAPVQQLFNHHDDVSGASSDAGTATVHGMRSMISVPPQHGVPIQPLSFGNHLLLGGGGGGVDPSLALRLAEMRAAHQKYQELVNSLHVRPRISSWPFHPSTPVLSVGYPPLESNGLQTTSNDISTLPWLGATAARGISSRGLLTSPLRSNQLISPVLGPEDFDSARKLHVPPTSSRLHGVGASAPTTFGSLISPSSDLHMGGRREGITILRDRTILQGLPGVSRLDTVITENAEGGATGSSEGAPSLFRHRSFPAASQAGHAPAPAASPYSGPIDGKMPSKVSLAVVRTSNQANKVGVSAEGQRAGDRPGSTTSAKHLVGAANVAEDPVVRAARLGTAADKNKTQDDQQQQTSMVLYVDGDEHYLTEYQCLLRKQLEVFEAGPHDIRGSTQGRNVPILLGQVGLRCRHCANLPLAARTKGAVYYSQTVEGMYQIAQNMSKVHLCQRCYRIPPDIQQELLSLKNECRRATGGKEYWTAALTTMGIYEDGPILRMKKG